MLKEGEIIEGPFWPEPIEVKKVENYGDYIHIVGCDERYILQSCKCSCPDITSGKRKATSRRVFEDERKNGKRGKDDKIG